ncbi:proline-, glutamic acid- and leucine-rich protein 1-like [Telopea speciosissima]|uniref:proline-, glutamic acid- and leucine-rich protein 1-like n=1 Tax=Telopea speciosissima TaxID=54955 RepID=UPI001CC5FAC9|nr:proline-, glutamic acid- and leucine-rich protein 1-like [Telopea speciosissima]
MVALDDKNQTISIRLNGNNYSYWSFIMENFLLGRGRLGYGTGSTEKPSDSKKDTYDAEISKWEMKNTKIMYYNTNNTPFTPYEDGVLKSARELPRLALEGHRALPSPPATPAPPATTALPAPPSPPAPPDVAFPPPAPPTYSAGTFDDPILVDNIPDTCIVLSLDDEEDEEDNVFEEECDEEEGPEEDLNEEDPEEDVEEDPEEEYDPTDDEEEEETY